MTTSTDNNVERLYSFGQIADLWQVSRDHVRKVFLHRPGIVNIGMLQGKASWRVPASVLKEEMAARGYQQGELKEGN
jgi:hypothetical protein